MTEILESPKNEVLIEYSSLSDMERKELEVFLKAQPEVESVGRRMRVMDSASPGDNLGLILTPTHIPWDHVLHLAKDVAGRAAPALVVELIRRYNARKDRKQRKEEEESTELVGLLGADGRTVKVVKRSKS